MPERPLRVLIVTYQFPPVGGAGVQRVLKLVKYLPCHGIEPAVLTVDNPSVPLWDDTLFRDVPQGTTVLRARTLEPGYGVKQVAWTAAGSGQLTMPMRILRRLSGAARQLLIPDPQILWQPAAQVTLLRRLLGPSRDDVVLVSGPPFSQFLLGLLPSLTPGVGVVLDYRDEWTTYRRSYEMVGSRLTDAVGEPLERALLGRADAVTTATDNFRHNLLCRFGSLAPHQISTIENGYDPDDFPDPLPEPPRDRFVLSYAGTLFKLTSPRGLLGAIRRLHAAEPELARLLHVRFMGRVVDTEREAFAGMEPLGVSIEGYVEHGKVLSELARSHMVLCLLDQVPGAEHIYPGKVFELMHLGRPCLTLAPDGALARLARHHQIGPVLHPRDEGAIAVLLAEKLRAFRDGTLSVRAEAVDTVRYHRRELAGAFARVLRLAAERARRRANGASDDGPVRGQGALQII